MDGGSNAVLDYLKDDLSERVNTIKTKQESVDEKVAAISGDVTSKLNAQNVKAAADLKRYEGYLQSLTLAMCQFNSAVRSRTAPFRLLCAFATFFFANSKMLTLHSCPFPLRLSSAPPHPTFFCNVVLRML